MTTETEFNISEEPLAERVLRQVRSGQLDEPRLLPSAEKRARDVGKKLNQLAALQGWHTFMAGQARSKPPSASTPPGGRASLPVDGPSLTPASRLRPPARG